jgi:hypothetical protein
MPGAAVSCRVPNAASPTAKVVPFARFAGGQARNAPIVDSVTVSHGKLRAAGRAIIRATTSAQLGKYLNRTRETS